MKSNKIIKLILVITLILIFIDQITKVLVKNNYQEPLGNDLVGITLIENTGIAFSLNSGNTKNIVLTLIILLIIINFVKNQKDIIDNKNALAISFILAGGISNLIDRIIYGGVTDFIKVKNFAIFNLADCYIVFGWILFIILFIKFNREIGDVKNCEKQ